MNEESREVGRLYLWYRVQSIAFFVAVTLIALVAVRAEGRARIPDVDAWRVSTKDAGGTLVDRLLTTSEVATARVKLQGANLELFPQPTAQLPSSPNAGAVAYDSTTAALKFFNGTQWIQTGSANKVLRVFKTADESLSNSTTLQDDDQLLFSIGANETWVVDYALDCTCPANNVGIQWAVVVPSGATITFWGLTGQDVGHAPDHEPMKTFVATSSGQVIVGGIQNAAHAGYRLHARVTNGSTAGQVKLQWAQGLSSANSITVKAGSFLVAKGF